MTGRGLFAVALLALAACATPVQLRYYTLSGSAPPPAQAVRAAPAYRVAIEPVTVPEFLDRMQIVLRVAPNRYAISDGERWSESLKREIQRVIADELGQRLPAAGVAADLRYAAQDADYRVLIDVLRFESVPGAGATLETVWTVRSRAGARLSETRSGYFEKVDAPGIGPLVEAHRKAVVALARDIAAALAAQAETKR